MEDLDSRYRVAVSFVRELLGSVPPFESTTAVLNYLLHESGSFHDSLATRDQLHTARSEAEPRLEQSIVYMRSLLRSCGIIDQDEKFQQLEIASHFSDPSTAPSIASLSISYVTRSLELLDLEKAHSTLLQIITELRSTSDIVSRGLRTVPLETLKRLEDDTITYESAIAELKSGNEQESTTAHIPSLNIPVILKEQQELSSLEGELASCESKLNSMRSIPLSLEEVLLENDRMQRQLEKLDQQRRDLFRSVRSGRVA